MNGLATTFRALRPRSLVAVFGGLALLTVYVYQGHHSFYTEHLPPGSLPGMSPAWEAHCWQFLAALLCMGLLPLAWWRLAERRPLAEVGLSLGDWRFGLKFLALAIPVLAVPLYINAGSPAFQAEYPLAGAVVGSSWRSFLAWQACYAVYYLAWEFFFRGFWQLGQKRHLGLLGAMALQASASTLLHIGKPEGETMAAVLAGLVFGLVALRSRSFLYVFLLHWYVGAATDLLCLVRAGVPA